MAIHEMLAQDPEALATLLAERDARLQAEQAGQGDVHAAALAQAMQLEGEIQTMLGYMRSGKAPASVLESIAALEAKLVELRATPAPPPPFDRAKFYRMFAGAAAIDMLVYSPQQLRACMRKLDIDSVIPYPDGKGGWGFEPVANLEGILTPGTPGERAG